MKNIFTEYLKKRTLARDLIFSLITTLTIVIIIITIINYIISVNNAEVSIDKRSNELLSQLSYSLKGPAWNFQTVHMENIIIGYAQSDYIHGIQVSLVQGGKINYFKNENKKNILIKKKNIFYGTQIIGSIEMFISQKLISELKFELLTLSFVFTLAIIITLFLSVQYLINKNMGRPFDNLLHGMDKIAKGAYGEHIPDVPQQDINIMIEKVNYMSDQIASREHQINEAREYLKNIIASMPSMIFAIDNNYNINLWNPALLREIGIGEADVLGKNLWHFLPTFKKHKKILEELKKNCIPITLHRQELPEKKGSLYEITFYPINSEKVSDIVIRIDDITEIENQRDQLRQMQKMETIGMLSGGLAHDFNNILNGIIGPLSMMKYEMERGTGKRHNYIEYITIIEESSVRASNIVQQLLSLSRKQDMIISEVNLNTSTKNVLKLCENTFDKSILLNFETSEQTPIVMGDPYLIEQALLNICVNAAHAMTIMRKEGRKQGGTLHVSIDQLTSDQEFISIHPEVEIGNYWGIHIKDNGVGISRSLISKIFDPFFTTKSEGKGTGLGLAMVYNIIKQQKGFIDVHSEEGIGTSFSIYLPCVEAKIDIEENRDYEDLLLGSGLILVCDDDHTMRLITERILKKCGYDVITSSDGEESIKKFIENADKIDGVILDIVMPKSSGNEVYDKIITLRKDIKILLTSGFRNDDRIKEVMEKGVTHFLPKPFTVSKLTRAVKKMMEDDE